MNEILVVIGFIVWYVASMIISEKLGKNKKIGVEWSFFICIVTSPIVGFIITKLSKKA